MMFSSTRNVDLICQIVKDLREYGSLRLERLELDMAQKLALVVGMLAMGAIVSVIVLVVLVFLSLAAGYALAPLVGGPAVAMLILAAFYGILACVIYAKRNDWIVAPLTLFLHELFLSDKD